MQPQPWLCGSGCWVDSSARWWGENADRIERIKWSHGAGMGSSLGGEFQVVGGNVDGKCRSCCREGVREKRGRLQADFEPMNDEHHVLVRVQAAYNKERRHVAVSGTFFGVGSPEGEPRIGTVVLPASTKGEWQTTTFSYSIYLG